MDLGYYHDLHTKHLNDSSTYRPLDHDPTHSISCRFTRWINALLKAGTTDDLTHQFLTLPQIKTQYIYFLPKLHKNPVGIRSIVACRGGLTETASVLLDRFLQPLAQTCKSYFKNTIEFINKIPQTHCQLVTLDVASLYTNISHDDVIETVRHAYSDHPLPYIPTLPILLLLLKYVLKNNVFSYNDCMY